MTDDQKSQQKKPRVGSATMAGAAIGSAALLAAALYAGSRRGKGRKRAADSPPPTSTAPHFDTPETD